VYHHVVVYLQQGGGGGGVHNVSMDLSNGGSYTGRLQATVRVVAPWEMEGKKGKGGGGVGRGKGSRSAVEEEMKCVELMA